MVKRNVLNDFAKYSKLTVSQVEQLVDLLEAFICDAVLEAQAKDEDILVLNLGLSTISIDLANGAWKSIPSDGMKKKLSDTKAGKTNPLEEILAEAISKKLLKLLGDCE